jgi:hypothetical protein
MFCIEYIRVFVPDACLTSVFRHECCLVVMYLISCDVLYGMYCLHTNCHRDRERDFAGGLMSIGTIFVEFAPYFQIYTDFVKKVKGYP